MTAKSDAEREPSCIVSARQPGNSQMNISMAKQVYAGGIINGLIAFIKINGKQHYLWRAVDQVGCELDILFTKKRDKRSAVKFFKKLFKGKSQQPRKITTDKLASYKVALRDLGCKTPHITKQYKNNIAEISHQKTRQQQRQMRQFVSIAQAQRFLSCHGIINNHFRQQRHLLKAKHYRFFRDRAFVQWTQDTCVNNMGIG